VIGSEQFQSLVEACAGWPGVQVPDGSHRGFGRTALRIDGSIFAMESHGRLVFKLPAERVQGLLDSGAGEPFTAGKAKWLTEWVSLPLDRSDAADLAREAYQFVGHR
jgi:hypothetical protein